MKRNFTKILAAFALLVGLTIPMGMWGQSTYTKVTTAPSNWSGTYVIVADDSNVIFTGQSGSNTYGGYAGVTISDNSVTGNFSAYEVEIEQSGDYYSMKHINSSKYLGWTGGNSLAFSTNAPSANSYRWVLSTSSILNANDNTRKLQYNSGSPRFACYTSNQKVAYLYKKEVSGDAPTITADPVTIGYNETSGNITYTIEPSTGASITNAVVTNSNPSGWLTVGTTYTSPISLSCEANTTASVKTATVTLTCTYGTNQTTTKTVSVTQESNPNAPGTQNNPYTVAQARAAIDAGTGTQGVYATGIVSVIVTPYGDGGYNNITFNMVDEGGTDFLQAFRCVGTDAPNVIVGDVAVVSGNLTKYGDTYEFASGCQVVSLTHPVTPYITADDVNITYDATSGSISYTINNSVTGGELTAETAATWLTLGTVGENVPFTCEANTAAAARTATVTLTYTYSRGTATKEVTVTQAGNPNVFDNISDITEVGAAYSVRGTVVAINSRGFVMGDGTGYVYYYKNGAPDQAVNDMITLAGTTGSYGHIIQFTGTPTINEATTSNYNGTPAATVITEVPDYTTGNHLSTYFEFEGELTKSNSNYFITLGENQIQISYPTTEQGTALTALDGKTVHVKGYFTGINSSSKFTVMLESVEEVYVPVVPVINAENVNIAFTATSGSIEYTIQDGEGMVTAVITEGDWLTLGEITTTEVPFTCSANDGAQRTATVTLSFDGAADKMVTITQAAYADIYTGEGTFNKVTSLTDLEDGGYYVLYGVNGSYKGAMNSSLSGGIMGSTSVTIENNAITNPAKAIVWKLEKNGDNWDLYNEEAEKYCYITGASAKSFALSSDKSEQNYVSYTVSVEEGNFYFIGGSNRMIAHYQNDFRTYADAKTLNLYKLGEASQDPYFTVEDVAIEYDAETGSITYTVNNPVEGGTVTAEVTDGEWLTLGQGTTSPISFTCSANTDYTSREATVTLTYTYNNSKPAVTATVTVTQGAAPYPSVTYTLATSIESGRHYIIVGNDGDNAFAMGNDKGSNRNAAGITINNNTATVSSVDVYEFVINGPDAEGHYTIYDAKWASTNGGYLYASSGSSNQLKTRQFNTDGNSQWSIAFDEENNATITANGNYSRNLMRFNPNNGSPIFACYASTSTTGSLPYLYVKDDDTNYEFYKDIAAYQGDGGYYLIASPVNNVNPANVAGMTTGSFDLYYYDDAQDREWINYKADENTINADFGNLVSGKGYLYANSANVTLAFTGTPYTGNGQASVVAGWNLIGNPFSVAATPNQPYYRLNAEGGELNAETESGAVNAMEGVFVNATAAGNVTFSTGTSKGQNVALNVSQNRGNVIDRAIVRFDEGQQLPKFQLFENSTKLYIPQGNKDFAIVRSAAEGEMPVNFRASENGTYTLSIETENVEMNYLHLIDNMTGADVDLLATPNYTFEARTNDYSSRFRLVFSAEENGASTDSATFAYFNGTSWTVSNTGDATLQVVDITGRIVSSETINGNATVSLNQPAGIYMLRLVNGNDVKVQKVVVR